LAILAAASLALLLASSDPEYPLGKLRFPSLTNPADPVMLTDFRYRFSENGSTVQRFEARVRLKAFAFLSGEVISQRRGVFFSTQRIDIGLTERRGRYVIEGGYRAARWLVRARAERRPPVALSSDATPSQEDASWVIDTRWAIRFNSDFELLFDLLEDTNSSASLPTRPLRRGALGFLYQRGNHLEILANASRSRVRTEGGIENDRNAVDAAAIFYRSGFQLDSTFAYFESTGRLAASEGFGAINLSAELGRYFVARASAANRWEPGVKRFEQDSRVGITFFGRRHHFFRGGEVGRRVLALTRRAYQLGYNERRVYNVDALLALRERLALSTMREELAADLDELYRAEVRERNVPQGGFEIARRVNNIDGVRSWTYRVFAGIPWRVDWPFGRDEDSVNFIRVEYTHEELDFSPDFRSRARELEIEVALNREMNASFRWTEPARTPTDIALLRPQRNRIELAYTYAFGR
jgi:hypothetical protein